MCLFCSCYVTGAGRKRSTDTPACRTRYRVNSRAHSPTTTVDHVYQSLLVFFVDPLRHCQGDIASVNAREDVMIMGAVAVG